MRRPGKEKWMNGWIGGLVGKCGTSIRLFNRPLICAGLFAVTALLIAGCAGYTLGPTNGVAAGDKKIQITPFLNHTFQPRLGDSVTTAVRKNIQSDGTYRLATGGDADIVVTGVLSHYIRHELNLGSNDVLTVQTYSVSVSAEVTARDVNAGTTRNWTNTASTLVRVGSDLPSSERQAMPVLAIELAKHVTDSIVDGTW
jgi:hypothetical protein